MTIAIWIFLFLSAVVIHEVAHGVVANWLGDDTAKRAGRLTLNPLKHIDWFWTVLFPAMLFISTQGRFMIGMAKPVPVNFGRLSRPKRDMIWVALAGPFSNIVLAGLLKIALSFWGSIYLLYAIYLNLGLAIFNLIPIPPLDGSRVAAGLMPRAWLRFYFSVERFGFMLILILYVTGILYRLVIPGINFFCYLLDIPRLILAG